MTEKPAGVKYVILFIGLLIPVVVSAAPITLPVGTQTYIFKQAKIRSGITFTRSMTEDPKSVVSVVVSVIYNKGDPPVEICRTTLKGRIYQAAVSNVSTFLCTVPGDLKNATLEALVTVSGAPFTTEFVER